MSILHVYWNEIAFSLTCVRFFYYFFARFNVCSCVLLPFSPVLVSSLNRSSNVVSSTLVNSLRVVFKHVAKSLVARANEWKRVG